MTLLSITDARAHKISFIEEKAHAELARIRKARDKQMYPYFREFETGGLHTTIAGHPIVNFSSNDYLGLTNHPKVKEAAHRAVDKYACGLSSSRVQATTVDHVSLENRLAKWFGFEKARHPVDAVNVIACLVVGEPSHHDPVIGRRQHVGRKRQNIAACVRYPNRERQKLKDQEALLSTVGALQAPLKAAREERIVFCRSQMLY